MRAPASWAKEEHTDRPLFRSSRNKPWTKGAVHKALKHLHAKLGWWKRLFASANHHSYVPDALANGVPLKLRNS